MIKAYDPNGDQFLADLSALQLRQATAQQQISSGLRVNKPSDAPQDIVDILRLKSEMTQNGQIQQNLGLVKAEVDGAQNALNSAITILTQANVVASQGTSPTMDATTRASLAVQVRGFLSQMVSLSGTTADGRYIFSGDADQSPAYKLDSASPNGVSQLATISSTRQVQLPGGGAITVSQSAQDIFDHRDANGKIAADNVFAALNSLANALENNDTAAMGQSIDLLHQSSDRLNLSLAGYGAAQNQVTSALDLASKFNVQFTTELSGKQDADIAAAALEVTQASTHLNAAMAAHAQLPRTSLFDYLK